MALVTNYGSLKAAIADYTLRDDCDDVIPNWIASAHIKLNEAAGPLTVMVNDDDSNALLDYDPDCYLFGALVQAGLYLRDQELVQAYAGLFEDKLEGLYMGGGIDILNFPPSQQPV